MKRKKLTQQQLDHIAALIKDAKPVASLDAQDVTEQNISDLLENLINAPLKPTN